jgi:hypothetical protein
VQWGEAYKFDDNLKNCEGGKANSQLKPLKIEEKNIYLFYKFMSFI